MQEGTAPKAVKVKSELKEVQGEPPAKEYRPYAEPNRNPRCQMPFRVRKFDGLDLRTFALYLPFCCFSVKSSIFLTVLIYIVVASGFVTPSRQALVGCSLVHSCSSRGAFCSLLQHWPLNHR